MNTVARHRQVFVAVGLLLLTACAMNRRAPAVVPASDLPADVTMNQGAGLGMMLFVNIRVEGGEELPFSVDTGAPYTSVPGILGPRLGESLGARRFSTLDSHDQVEQLYAAPKLFLGKTRLVTGPKVGASGEFGVLGMDCLQHYCIQLDFKTRTMRFLRSDQISASDLGKRFPLKKSNYALIKHAAFFQQKEVDLVIDTGCLWDGYLNSPTFERVVREQHARSLPLFQDGAVHGTAPGVALFHQGVWDGETYDNLIMGKGFDLVGLKFLGRHQVTFDFPSGAMYLKRIADDAPANAGSQ